MKHRKGVSEHFKYERLGSQGPKDFTPSSRGRCCKITRKTASDQMCSNPIHSSLFNKWAPTHRLPPFLCCKIWRLGPNPLPERLDDIIVRELFILCIQRVNEHNSYHLLYDCPTLDTVPGSLVSSLYPYNDPQVGFFSFSPLEGGSEAPWSKHGLGFSYGISAS